MPRRPLGYGRQFIDETDEAAILEVLRGDFLTQGDAVPRFEEALALTTGAAYAIAVSSGTAALHLACLASGADEGRSGVTSALTFVASANALSYAGLEVVLTDVDPQSLLMTPERLSRATAPAMDQPGVVIPVHFAGLATDTPAIASRIPDACVVEDAAHSLGGTYVDGSPVGSCPQSAMTVFSFHPVKAITTGEGGAITTNDPDLAERLRRLRSHGIERNPMRFLASPEPADSPAPWYYEQQELGFNYRMTDLQAALGLSQLNKLQGFIERRREIVGWYDAAFSELPGLSLPQAEPAQRNRSAHHLYVVELDFAHLGKTRSEVMQTLISNGVGSQVHYIPVHKHPFHSGSKTTQLSVVDRYYERALTLPLFPAMTDDDVELVVHAVTELVSPEAALP